MRTVEIHRGYCVVKVEGKAMRCPLCSMLVQPGESHVCKTEEWPPRKRAPRQGVLHERVSK
jgi:hypothetical protein